MTRLQHSREVVREALRRYEGALSAERDAIRHVIREGREAIANGTFTTISTTADSEALLSRLTRRG